jgi:CRP/FNR family transcriptional regulator, polysaccharide utilization system transcription regulator
LYCIGDINNNNTMLLDKNSSPDCENCLVRRLSIFKDLETVEIDTLETSKDRCFYKKGQIIFQEGNHPNGIFEVHSGKVKIFKLGSNAREQIIELAKPGHIMGYQSLISGELYNISASALEDSIICFFPKAIFMTMIEKNSSLMMRMMKLMSRDLSIAEYKMVEIVQKPVRDRLAEALLIFKDTYGLAADGQTLNVTLTREDIANFIGTTPETAIRLLSEFKSEKLIALDKRKIKILNTKGLVHASNINK